MLAPVERCQTALKLLIELLELGGSGPVMIL